MLLHLAWLLRTSGPPVNMSPQQSLVLLLMGMISFMSSTCGMGMSLGIMLPWYGMVWYGQVSGDIRSFGTARRAQAQACLSTGARVTVVLMTFRVLAQGGAGVHCFGGGRYNFCWSSNFTALFRYMILGAQALLRTIFGT